MSISVDISLKALDALHADGKIGNIDHKYLHGAIEQLAVERDTWKSIADNLSDKMSDKDEKISFLKEQLDTFKDSRTYLKGEISRLNAEIAKLQNRYNAMVHEDNVSK